MGMIADAAGNTAAIDDMLVGNLGRTSARVMEKLLRFVAGSDCKDGQA